MQGAPSTLHLRVGRWVCRNTNCQRKIFTEPIPAVAAPHQQRTGRVEEAVQLVGYSLGGRPAERLMNRLGMAVSNDTILRQLKKRAAARVASQRLRVVGIDDWAWRKGQTYGTILVDLERREVVDLLPDRSAEQVALWLHQHPTVEIVSRDRFGLYARGALSGAPQARQIADRFHLIVNLKDRSNTNSAGSAAIWSSILPRSDRVSLHGLCRLLLPTPNERSTSTPLS